MDRFANLKTPKGFIQDEVIRAVKNVLNIEIEPEEVEWRAGVIYIKTQNQILKNEIFLRKEKILEILKERLSKKAPLDIRF